MRVGPPTQGERTGHGYSLQKARIGPNSFLWYRVQYGVPGAGTLGTGYRYSLQTACTGWNWSEGVWYGVRGTGTHCRWPALGGTGLRVYGTGYGVQVLTADGPRRVELV